MLELINLSKSYYKNNIFSNVNLTLNETGLVFLIGSSGSGKTTLLNIIYGLDDEYRGIIKRECSISYMTQDNTLFNDMSVYDNLRLYGKSEDIDEYLDIFHLMDKKYVNVSYLSLGEKKRIQFISTILKESSVYLFDEPFASLDKDNKYKVLEILKKKSEESLIIVSTHELMNECSSYIKIINERVESNIVKGKKIKKKINKIALWSFILINKKNVIVRNIAMIMCVLLLVFLLSFSSKEKFVESEDFKIFTYIEDDVMYRPSENQLKEYIGDDSSVRDYIEYDLKEKMNVFVNGEIIEDYEFIAIRSNDIYINDVFYKKYGGNFFVEIDNVIEELNVYYIDDIYINPIIYIPYERYKSYIDDSCFVYVSNPLDIEDDLVEYNPYLKVDQSMGDIVNNSIDKLRIVIYVCVISVWLIFTLMLFEINRKFYKNLYLNISFKQLLIYMILERFVLFFISIKYKFLFILILLDILVSYLYLRKRIKVIIKC